MFETVCSILAELTDTEIGSMTPETDLLNDLGLNSLDVMEAVIRFEEEFSIRIPDRRISGFRTIRDVMEYVEKERV